MKRITISLAATPTLFHITSTLAASKIVTKDLFELKPSDGTAAEETMNKGGAYYLSMTRSKVGAFTLTRISTTAAIFVLDGVKLAQNFKITPVNYWGEWAGMTPQDRTRQDEAEDRLLSNKPSFKASKYIVEVHAHIGKDGERERNWAIALKRICMLKKIPAFFYDDILALRSMNKHKAVTLNLKDKVPVEPPYENSPEYKRAQYKERGQNCLAGWIELATYPLDPSLTQDDIYKLSKVKLSKYADMAYRRLAYAYNDDAFRSLQTDLHNAKSLAYGEIRGERESLDKLIALLRKRKQSVKEFIRAQELKWYPRTAK